MAKKISELPQELQERLAKEKSGLYRTWHQNDAYHVCFTDKVGKFYIYAKRDNGFRLWSRCAGVNGWYIKFGKVQCKHGYDVNVIGERTEYYRWVKGTTYLKFIKADGTLVEIPQVVSTKKELMDIVKQLGIFEIDIND